jgi:hypothetical protein
MPNQNQLKINFEANKQNEVKVISIKRAQNKAILAKILNRKRPTT